MAKPELRFVQPGEESPPRTFAELRETTHGIVNQIHQALPPLGEALEGARIIAVQGVRIIFTGDKAFTHQPRNVSLSQEPISAPPKNVIFPSREAASGTHR